MGMRYGFWWDTLSAKFVGVQAIPIGIFGMVPWVFLHPPALPIFPYLRGIICCYPRGLMDLMLLPLVSAEYLRGLGYIEFLSS